MGKGYKWARTKLLNQSPELREHLPETHIFTTDRLFGMLHKYGKVIVKPSVGSGGTGVIQVSKTEAGPYRVHRDHSVRTFHGEDALRRYAHKRLSSRTHIIQKRISLAEIGKRPMDLRVMVQRKKGGDWTITGKLAKVAGPGYIVTNLRRSRGKILPADSALRRASIAARPTGEILSELGAIALMTARKLETRYTKQKMYGMDMAVDKKGKIWIIEANFTPSTSLFRRLKDKSMYHRILRYKKASK